MRAQKRSLQASVKCRFMGSAAETATTTLPMPTYYNPRKLRLWKRKQQVLAKMTFLFHSITVKPSFRHSCVLHT